MPIRGHSIVAQNSCEAEWYGVATASGEGLFMKHLLLRLGVDLELRVHTDSSAAKAVGLRLGSGKLRSLEVKTLWVQHEVKAKRLQLYKTAGDRNIADLGTKAYAAAAFELLGDLGFRQRRLSRTGWSDSESSEWATVGAVGRATQTWTSSAFDAYRRR